MENNENPNRFRTPLATKTQKNNYSNFIQQTKQENKQFVKQNEVNSQKIGINEYTKQNYTSQQFKVEQNLSKTKLIRVDEDEDIDPFYYNNQNQNFNSRETPEKIVNENDFDPIVLKEELPLDEIKAFTITMNEIQEEARQIIDLKMRDEIFLVNRVDFQRKEYFNNVFNEGLTIVESEFD
jgi:hypothetical protein